MEKPKKKKKYDKNTPAVGDLLIAGKNDRMYFSHTFDPHSNTGVHFPNEVSTEMLPALVIRVVKDDVFLLFPRSKHTWKESKRRLRFRIKRRELGLQKVKK